MFKTRLDVSTIRAPAARRVGPPQVGPWRLISLLGSGQSTRVFKAHPADSPGGGADYAVKVARSSGQFAGAADSLLAREAQVGRAVYHPHLVPILSANLDSSPRYVVMPCLEGVTLAAALAGHRQPSLPHALWIARQIAEGLAALHGRGWLHADVKPGNIIVSSGGHATLIDLGFARPLNKADSACGRDLIRATFAYASPEVFTRALAGGESDVYSLGVTLYEMLTGRLPFLETDPTDLAVAHLQRPVPDPRSLCPQLPPRVSWLLKRMLAKDPLRRPNAAELVPLLVELEVESFAERR